MARESNNCRADFALAPAATPGPATARPPAPARFLAPAYSSVPAPTANAAPSLAQKPDLYRWLERRTVELIALVFADETSHAPRCSTSVATFKISHRPAWIPDNGSVIGAANHPIAGPILRRSSTSRPFIGGAVSASAIQSFSAGLGNIRSAALSRSDLQRAVK